MIKNKFENIINQKIIENIIKMKIKNYLKTSIIYKTLNFKILKIIHYNSIFFFIFLILIV